MFKFISDIKDLAEQNKQLSKKVGALEIRINGMYEDICKFKREKFMRDYPNGMVTQKHILESIYFSEEILSNGFNLYYSCYFDNVLAEIKLPTQVRQYSVEKIKKRGDVAYVEIKVCTYGPNVSEYFVVDIAHKVALKVPNLNFEEI